MGKDSSETTIIRGLALREQGPRLVAQREGAGMTQAALAKALGWATSTIGMMEQGKRGIGVEQALELSAHFDVPGEWFLGTLSQRDAMLLAIERDHHGKIYIPREPSHVIDPRKLQETKKDRSRG